MNPPRLTEGQRRVYLTYMLLNGVFAFAYGLYASYALVYLSAQLHRTGVSPSTTVLDNILVVLAATMLFELFAEPLTGDFADTHGRRRAAALSFSGMAVCCLLYWATALVPNNGGSQALITLLAIMAELVAAVALAFYSGTLDAWFVDELGLEAPGSAPGDLQPYFARTNQVFGLSLVAGGAVSFLLMQTAMGESGTGSASFFSFASFPWPLAAATMVLTTLSVVAMMGEKYRPATGSRSKLTRVRLLERLVSLAKVKPYLRATASVSLLYVCWMLYLYLMPVLMTDSAILGSNSVVLAWCGENFWVFWLLLGLARLVGPMVSSRVRFRNRGSDERRLQFRVWGLLNAGLLLISGILFLLNVGSLLFLVPFTLFLAKTFEEAFKPVRSAYLNELIPESGDRAFALSMATPVGSGILVLGSLVVVVTQVLSGPDSWLGRVANGVPVLFVLGGGVAVVVVTVATRQRGSADDGE